MRKSLRRYSRQEDSGCQRRWISRSLLFHDHNRAPVCGKVLFCALLDRFLLHLIQGAGQLLAVDPELVSSPPPKGSAINAVQDACNLVAIVNCLHGHLLSLHRAGIGGDSLINHPTSLAFVSKLNSLCRMTLDREMAALDAIDKLKQGESAEYEVIPL